MKRNILTLTFMVVFMLVTTNSQAQSSLKNIVSNVVSAITGSNDMTGTWNYSGAAVEFESDNLLKKAGGAVAASALEKELSEQLSKLGISEGGMSYTFDADSTFTNTFGSKSLSGTYSYNSSTSKMTMKYIKLISISAKVNYSSKSLDLLFDVDKLLTLLTLIGDNSGSTIIQTITSLVGSYDGLMIGFNFTR